MLRRYSLPLLFHIKSLIDRDRRRENQICKGEKRAVDRDMDIQSDIENVRDRQNKTARQVCQRQKQREMRQILNLGIRRETINQRRGEEFLFLNCLLARNPLCLSDRIGSGLLGYQISNRVLIKEKERERYICSCSSFFLAWYHLCLEEQFALN